MKKIPENITIIINEFIEKCSKILGDSLKQIILYGSYARGDYNKDSDIDIMILTTLADDELYKYFVKISDMAYDIEAENDFNITLSPVLKNINKFNYWNEVMPYYMNVKKEGVILK